jgi:enoyl-CoA hydratase
MADLEFERRGALGLVTLNRPDALNALTHAMVLELDRRLAAWEDEPGVAVVAIRGAGEKAFCAGGDIRALWEAGRGGRTPEATFPFYADEYRMNARIKRYPKPLVALIDGIVMGGGVGVSVHAARRIAGDRTRFAMPETGIGLFPDVGGTHFLPRLPGETGMWLALTGARLGPVDTLKSGIADHYMPSDRFGELIDALAGLEIGPREPIEAVDWAIEALARQPEGPSVLEEHRERIDRLFAGPNVEGILGALDGARHYWAEEQRAEILKKSPTCTRIAFRQVREGAGLSFEDCMRLEYRLVRFCMAQPDFYEGVRAALIDRDQSPKWDPPTLAGADEAHVAPAFLPLGPGEELHL